MAAGDGTMKNFKAGVVWSMVALRVLLCPVMIWGAKAGWSGIWLAAIKCNRGFKVGHVHGELVG